MNCDNCVVFTEKDWVKTLAEVRVFQPPELCEGRMSNVLANIKHTHTHAPQMVVEEGKKLRNVGEICAEENGESMVYNMKSYEINSMVYIILTVVIWWERYASLQLL